MEQSSLLVVLKDLQYRPHCVPALRSLSPQRSGSAYSVVKVATADSLEFRPGATGPRQGSLVILDFPAPGAFDALAIQVEGHPAVVGSAEESLEHLVYLLHKLI